MSAQTVGLAMIVRDNAAVLARCLASCRSHIDHWTIVDTGSTDETVWVAETLLAGKPGSLHHRPWVNSGHNRTELLALARGTADYLLLLDADHELRTTGPLPPLTRAVYMLRESQNGLEWSMPRLVDGQREWRYEGVAHEYLADTDDREPFDAWSVLHHGDGRTTAEKLAAARRELEETFAANPADPRTVFYLAQTHRDLGNTAEAIALYRLRAQMAGWDEETFLAQYELGCLLTEHVSFHKGAPELLRAYGMRPGRVEPLRALATAATAIADRTPSTDDLLFVHRDQYRNV